MPKIDTLAASRDLKAAGADPTVAEAIVRLVSHTDEDLATKSDIETAVATLKADMLKMAITTIFAVTTLNVGITALLFQLFTTEPVQQSQSPQSAVPPPQQSGDAAKTDAGRSENATTKSE